MIIKSNISTHSSTKYYKFSKILSTPVIGRLSLSLVRQGSYKIWPENRIKQKLDTKQRLPLKQKKNPYNICKCKLNGKYCQNISSLLE